ncbi:hypothetical protein OHS57_21070 [Streptomyces sp. NBC_00370]
MQFLGTARDFVAFLDASARTPLHPGVVTFTCEDQRMAGTAEVALRWCVSREERIRTFANSRPTHGGGIQPGGLPRRGSARSTPMRGSGNC